MIRTVLIGSVGVLLGALVALLLRPLLSPRLPDELLQVARSPDGALVSWRAHRGACTAIDAHSSGTIIVTAGADGVFRSWQPEPFELVNTYAWRGSPLAGVAFPPDGSFFAVANPREIAFWRFDGTLVRTHITGEPLPTSMHWSMHEPIIAVAGSSGLTLYDTERGRDPRTIVADQLVTTVCFFDDGRAFLYADAAGVVHARPLFGAEDSSSFANGRPVLALAATLDGSRVLTADRAGLRLWDRAAGTPVHEWSGHSGPATRAVLLDSGRAFLTISPVDNAARVWAQETGAPLAALEGVLRMPLSVASFRNQDDRVLVSDATGRVFIWDWRKSPNPAPLPFAAAPQR